MNNRTTIILVAVVAVLAVAVVMLMTQGRTAPQTAPGATAGQQTPTGTTSPPGAAGPPTKLPSGSTPAKFVQTYYQAILDEQWDKAWAMQPATSKGMGDAKAFEQNQKMYGMKSFRVAKTTADGPNKMTVEVKQDLGTNGKWTSIWQFEKKSGTWIAVDKKSSMQP